MIKAYGYETARQRRTFDTYNDVDCFNYSDVHDYIKFLKHGYGKVTDHASREIRLKRLTREQGIELVKKYQNIKPSKKSLRLFLRWVGMSEKDFYKAIDKFRSPMAWQKVGKTWKLKDSIMNHAHDSGVSDARLKVKERCVFKLTKPKQKASENEYILLGRGWVDGWEK